MAEAGSDVRWGSLSADDVGDWAVLTNLLAVVDRTDEIYQAEDLAEELREQGFDPAADTMAVRVDGQLVGFGQLRVGMELVEGEATAWIHGGVHPDFRRRGFGTQHHGPAGAAGAAAERRAAPGPGAVVEGARRLGRGVRRGSCWPGAGTRSSGIPTTWTATCRISCPR